MKQGSTSPDLRLPTNRKVAVAHKSRFLTTGILALASFCFSSQRMSGVMASLAALLSWVLALPTKAFFTMAGCFVHQGRS